MEPELDMNSEVTEPVPPRDLVKKANDLVVGILRLQENTRRQREVEYFLRDLGQRGGVTTSIEFVLPWSDEEATIFVDAEHWHILGAGKPRGHLQETFRKTLKESEESRGKWREDVKAWRESNEPLCRYRDAVKVGAEESRDKLQEAIRRESKGLEKSQDNLEEGFGKKLKELDGLTQTVECPLQSGNANTLTRRADSQFNPTPDCRAYTKRQQRYARHCCLNAFLLAWDLCGGS